MPEFPQFVNGVAKLGLSAAAVTLSSTILKEQLIPFQIQWLGVAGSVVAACMIPIAFTERAWLGRAAVRRILLMAILVTLVGLIWSRAAYVVPSTQAGTTRNYLIGRTLSEEGLAARANCGQVIDDSTFINCAGTGLIPQLYGSSYRRAYILYIADYLTLLALFVLFIAPIDLRTLPVGTDGISEKPAERPESSGTDDGKFPQTTG
jgi:hypothetical protein